MPDIDAQNLSSGALFHNRYRIVKCIKSGGMGTVYEVRDENTASPRALKVMLPSVLNDADQRARFMREAKLTGNIESDHIVKVSDSGVDDASGSPFLVMELLRGQELGDILESKGGLPAQDVVLYLNQAARALDKTHEAGIVHRDLKPSNLFLTHRDDGSPCVKILDFGIAKVSAQSEANKTRALGTPLYMAPEQIRGEGNLRRTADVYALAHVAYALLVGEPYWHEESEQHDSIVTLLMKVVSGQFGEAPSARAKRRKHKELSSAFDAWFYRATALNPDQRFEKAGDAIAALAQALSAPAQAVHDHQAHHVHHAHHAHHAHALQYAQVSQAPAWTAAQTAAPQVSQQPKKSSAPVALFAVGGIATLALIVGIVAIAGGGDSKAANDATQANQNVQTNNAGQNAACPSDAVCANVNTPNPKALDAGAMLAQMKAIAQKENSKAQLIRISIAGPNSEGLADITGDLPIQFQYGTPDQSVTISLRSGQAIVRTGPGLSVGFAVDEPKCGQKAAFAAAVKDGFPSKGAGRSLTYTADPTDGAAAWLLNAPNQMVIVDGKSCALKTHTKW